MSKKFNWMPILKTGTFTDKNGQTVTFTKEDLDKVVANTVLKEEPQIVIEHPKFDKLGFGTITELKRVGEFLFALPDKVNEKFAEAVNSGELPGRSASLYKDTLALSSLGFLPPEIPPAVDGLGAYSFSSSADGGSATYNFSLPGVESHFAELESDKYEFQNYENTQWPFNAIKSLFRNLKNYLIETAGLEKADRIMNDWSIDETGNPPKIFSKETTYNNFSQNINGDEMSLLNENGQIDFGKIDLSKPDAIRAALKELADNNAALAADLQKSKTELSVAQTTLTAKEQAEARAEVLQFCESDEMKLKIIPADKEKFVQALLKTKGGGKIELSAADGTKTPFDVYEFLKEQFKALPVKIELQEIATTGSADSKEPDYKKIAKEIASYAK